MALYFLTTLLKAYTASMKALCVFMLATAMALIIYSQANAFGLKENSTVEGEYIRLGDVFYGLNEGEEKILGPSPAPGKDMVLNARSLLKIAKAMGVNWRPSSASDQVVLTREASIVKKEDIQEQIKAALESKGVKGTYDISFSSGTSGNITLAPEMPATVEVDNLVFQPEKNTFEAILYAPSKSNAILRQNVTGSIHRLINIPTLANTLKQGDIIGAHDIQMIEAREETITSGLIVKAEDLIGMTPKRILTPGQPIKEADIIAPQIVRRGDIVTMTYAQGALRLTSKGKALENGSKNDVIRVVNMNSSKTIEAMVTNTREVEVRAF